MKKSNLSKQNLVLYENERYVDAKELSKHIPFSPYTIKEKANKKELPGKLIFNKWVFPLEEVKKMFTPNNRNENNLDFFDSEN